MASTDQANPGGSPVADPADVLRRTDRVLRWFDGHGRDLEWRRDRDPWRILVAELMLQQTQASRVVERWPVFLEQFPTVLSCADAPRSAVIEQWRGLGYNRRAVNLHRAAIVVRDDFEGVMPSALADLLRLPGVGAYTARAVRAFAFELDDGVVDTNIGRVLARLGGRALRPIEAQRLADHLVPDGRGWAWNQALMEVGALICRPAPLCEGCPLESECHWRSHGHPDPDPAMGSAAVSRSQLRFEGSDRQGRGRLIDALRGGPLARTEIATVMNWPTDPHRAARVASSLLVDGLMERHGDFYRLPTRAGT